MMVKELFTLARRAQAERRLPGFRAQQWFFFGVAAFWVYIRWAAVRDVHATTSACVRACVHARVTSV
jgi:hypothetical protein